MFRNISNGFTLFKASSLGVGIIPNMLDFAESTLYNCFFYYNYTLTNNLPSRQLHVQS